MQTSKQMMKVAKHYKAGVTRRDLKIITDAPMKEGCNNWFVDRNRVGVFQNNYTTSVFINPIKHTESEKVWVGIVIGYYMEKYEGEFLVFDNSVATCESGVIIVAKPNSIISISAYKNRGPKQYYQLTETGMENVTDTVNAAKQESV